VTGIAFANRRDGIGQRFTVKRGQGAPVSRKCPEKHQPHP